MKKLLSVALASLVLVGCGSEENKTMTCKMDQEGNGVKLSISIDYKYSGKSIYSQNQSSTVVASDGDTFDQLYTSMEAMDFAGKVEDMKGVQYSLTKDDEKLSISEVLKIKFGDISADDYQVITSGASDVSGDKKILLELDKTIESMEAQGLTCTK